MKQEELRLIWGLIILTSIYPDNCINKFKLIDSLYDDGEYRSRTNSREIGDTLVKVTTFEDGDVSLIYIHNKDIREFVKSQYEVSMG